MSDWNTDSECESETGVNFKCLLSETELIKCGGYNLSALSVLCPCTLHKHNLPAVSLDSTLNSRPAGMLIAEPALKPKSPHTLVKEQAPDWRGMSRGVGGWAVTGQGCGTGSV